MCLCNTQVCATRYEFVENLLTKIARVDVQRLSRSGKADEEETGTAAGEGAKESKAAVVAAAMPVKRNDSTSVNAARERYLQRKQQGKK